ncbi:MAG TPA: hypothetical protein VLA28_03105, partial [Afifellaceae bacterium]|nr:hypothetical protein [Afifellaceae bacterium]
MTSQSPVAPEIRFFGLVLRVSAIGMAHPGKASQARSAIADGRGQAFPVNARARGDRPTQNGPGAMPDPARLEIGRLYARFNSALSHGAVWLRQQKPWLQFYLQQYSGGGGIWPGSSVSPVTQ